MFDLSASQPEESPADLSILVVEDSRTQAERLRHLLQREGYQVAVAANGRLALGMLRALRPHLVISDVNMPEMDGYELSRRLKAMPQFRDLPVILVTTMSDPQDVIRGLECGADNFVLKPFNESYMLARVRYVLANRGMRGVDDAAAGVGIFFNGQRHFITADRPQILNLLLSTYEAAIQRNRELSESQESLEKRSAEITLAHRFLDQVIDNIPHIIFVKDASDLRFLQVNRALVELMGLPKESVIGKTDHDLFPASEADCYTANDRQVLASGTSGEYDLPVQTVRNGLRTLRTRKLVIYDESNQPRFLLGISEDVTQKKEREREILRLNEELKQRTAEADAANRAKSTFLATMSHEIRTPMNGMLGMLELLSLSALDGEQRATLEIIRESSASLLRIVDDVLDFSKIEAGQMEIHPEPASLRPILAEVERMYAAAAASKGLALRSMADSDLSPLVRVDALRLRQILGNFVSNAIKFTQQGSVEIVAQRTGRVAGLEQVQFIVRDTGIGISPENQRRLFQPFSQGDAEAARRAGGTGLGLTICRRLAEMMGGTVEMTSELGRGTTMRLALAFEPVNAVAAQEPARQAGPFAAAADKSRRAPDAAQAERDGTLVLLVDDHPTNRTLLQRQLKILGYASETAEDGDEAFRLWQSRRFAVVITDCEMPGMDGYELARSIRRAEAAGGDHHTPVIACTAHAMAGEAEKCMQAGMDDCLVKPIDLTRLQQKLRQWLPLPQDSADAAPAYRPAPHGGTQAVDLALVRETWGDGEETLREIFTLFQRTNDEDARTLLQAVQERDLAKAARASHRMLGSSRMVGAYDFAAVCERIHSCTQAAAWDVVQTAMHEFASELARLNACIGSLAGSREEGEEAGRTRPGFRS